MKVELEDGRDGRPQLGVCQSISEALMKYTTYTQLYSAMLICGGGGLLDTPGPLNSDSKFHTLLIRLQNRSIWWGKPR